MDTAMNSGKIGDILKCKDGYDWKNLAVDLANQMETSGYLFYQMISSFPNSIMFLSDTGKVMSASSLMLNKYLEASMEEIIDQSIENLDFKIFADKKETTFLRSLLIKALISHTNYENVSIEAMSKNDNKIYLNVSIKALFTPSGEFLGLLLYITEQIVKLDLTTSEGQSELVLKKMGTLSAGVVHEIRNPIQGISGINELLKLKYKDDPTIQGYCQVLSDEIQQVNILLTEFLACTNVDKPQLELSNLNKICHDVLPIAASKLVSRSIDVDTIFDKNVPKMMIDPGKIRQILINALMNACDAIEEVDIDERRKTEPDYEPLVTLSTHFDFGLNEAHLVIEDNGKGMKPKVLENVTRPFFTTKKFGIGMGVHIMNMVAQDHGGRLDISSVEGVGSKFDFVFPELAGLYQNYKQKQEVKNEVMQEPDLNIARDGFKNL